MKGDSLPDISKFAEGKKNKCDERGVFSLKAGKKQDEDFTDFTFKENNVNTVSLKDLYIQEKGKDKFNKMHGPQASASAPKVKGGAKRKIKAASKAKKGTPGEIRQKDGKVLTYTPSKTLITTKVSPSKGKASAAGKKSTTGKKYTPAMPSPGGKQSKHNTTDEMTMRKFKKYLEYHEKRKGSKVLGKRSAGGKTSGKASKGKKSTK